MTKNNISIYYMPIALIVIVCLLVVGACVGGILEWRERRNKARKYI